MSTLAYAGPDLAYPAVPVLEGLAIRLGPQAEWGGPAAGRWRAVG